MKYPILYTFRRCPYAIRARMALSYCKIKVELREISLKNRPKQLYDASNKGTVPVLITKNNKVIAESLDIMLWALQNNTKQTWFNVQNSNEDLQMIKVNDTIFKKSLDKYKYHNRYPEKNKEIYRIECCKTLNVYEKKLAENKYLNDDEIKIIDIAIFPFVRQFANVDYPWFKSEFNNLTVWLEKISNSKLFNSVMKKYELWNPSIFLQVDLSVEI